MAYLHERRHRPAMTLALPAYNVNQGPGPMSAPVAYSPVQSPLSPNLLSPLSAVTEYGMDPALHGVAYYMDGREGIVRPQSTSPESGAEEGGGMRFINATVESVKEQIIREETMPKKKRVRTSTTQLNVLQQAFAQDPMPSAAVRTALAEKLGMTSRAVQVWFQNRRAKMKLDQKRGSAAGLLERTAFLQSPPLSSAVLNSADDASVKMELAPTNDAPLHDESDDPASQAAIVASSPLSTKAPRSVQRLRTTSNNGYLGPQNVAANPNLARHNSLPNIHHPDTATPGYPSPASSHVSLPLPHMMSRHNSIDCGDCITDVPPIPPSPTFSNPPSPSFTRRPSLLRTPNASPALQTTYFAAPRTSSPSVKHAHHPYFPSRMVSRRHSVFEQVPSGRVIYPNGEGRIPGSPLSDIHEGTIMQDAVNPGALDLHLLHIQQQQQQSPPLIQSVLPGDSNEYFNGQAQSDPNQSAPTLCQPLHMDEYVTSTDAPADMLSNPSYSHPTWETQQQTQLTLSTPLNLDHELLNSTTNSLEQLQLTTITEDELFNGYSTFSQHPASILDMASLPPAADISSPAPNPMPGHKRSNSWMRRSMSSPDIYGFVGMVRGTPNALPAFDAEQ
ncbi:uncharacterized protein SPPG_05249 [Spizellomyces punctatus DAOM BR117]|uniref:Homeobox domain-containing protein n=1 Tax=Spizellomyces punctatus (strain DAOM BR117) TaxID=645134 RepID=A0A0L0HFH4_SPIPD|nr:uncharacterized protein SPPG_05249 [Spizellomyces punctatus DAOM BR117]KNC99877.1 hypothetical protein SPPG_05249 [Spizellomyces punctatus DAOM BR117]|eukprot:XP_016607917.1 hypothetical protein SPPG_05249 [Spizellomyces punctatus DAOM BR117]